MDIKDLYSYIKQNATDDYVLLKNKIDTFSKEGVDPIKIYNAITQYIALKPFCHALDVVNGDYINFIKAIKIATFLKAKFNDENSFSVMQKTLVYKDNDVCIFKPTHFQESSIIGEPICCFAYSKGRWNEHYNTNEEAIYYVYDVMRDGTIEDFVAITVRPNGRAFVLDKDHKWWSKIDSIRYIQGLGKGASTIVTKEGKSIKTENKQYIIMKQTIRLNESDLHKIVRESVKKILDEISDTVKQDYIDGRRQQGMGNKPLSNAMLRKGEKDLARGKAQGYPCGGAKNGEEFAQMDADGKATQMYMNGRGKYSYGY